MCHSNFVNSRKLSSLVEADSSFAEATYNSAHVSLCVTGWEQVFMVECIMNNSYIYNRGYYKPKMIVIGCVGLKCNNWRGSAITVVLQRF